MNEVRQPLKRSMLAGISLLLVSLCIGICVLQYFSIRRSVISSFQSYIGNVLQFTASTVDPDDLAECIRTGKKSPKYEELQRSLDQIREHMDMHFIYIIVPLNTNETDNIRNVIAGATAYEYQHESDELVQLNQLTGNAYPPATAQKYLDAYQSGKLSFFEETSQWGTDLTGLLPLFDSSGNPVAALCMDIDISFINEKIVEHLLNTCLIIFIIGLLFATVFIVWSDRSILRPIRLLEQGMARITARDPDLQDPDALVLDVPEIENRNEVGMLARSAEKMSRDLRDHTRALVSREKELARVSASASRDDLTHVGNLAAYNQYAEKLQLKMTEGPTEYAILLADVDDLKKQNDSYGHDRGNQYLKNCCAVICDVFRHSPVFRIGGDEFVVVLTGEDFLNRRDLLKEARERFRQSWINEDISPWERLSVSIGIAEYRENEDKTVQQVLNRADHAMYEARNLKKNNT